MKRLKKLNKLYNSLKKFGDSQIYSIPGWKGSIVEYSAQFIAGKDPKVKKVKNKKIN